MLTSGSDTGERSIGDVGGGVRSAGDASGGGAELDSEPGWAEPHSDVEAGEADDVAEPVISAMSETDATDDQLRPETPTTADRPGANRGSAPGWREELRFPDQSEGDASEMYAWNDRVDELATQAADLGTGTAG